MVTTLALTPALTPTVDHCGSNGSLGWSGYDWIGRGAAPVKLWVDGERRMTVMGRRCIHDNITT